MTEAVIYYCVGLIALTIATNHIKKSFNELFFLMTNSREVGIFTYALLFFPGTVIHEMAHFLMAAILGVRTGSISLFPEKVGSGHVHLGSVEVEKTDFIRSSLIGIAPFVSGTILLVYLSSNVDMDQISSFLSVGDWLSKHVSSPLFWVQMYLILAVSNTLFASKEDRRHWPVLAVFIIGCWLLISLIGVNISVSREVVLALGVGLKACGFGFLAGTVINILILLLIRVMIMVIEKSTGKKIIYQK